MIIQQNLVILLTLKPNFATHIHIILHIMSNNLIIIFDKYSYSVTLLDSNGEFVNDAGGLYN